MISNKNSWLDECGQYAERLARLAAYHRRHHRRVPDQYASDRYSPHAGVRYNQLKTKGFTTKNTHREAVFTTQEETLDIWQFPVGVKLNKTFDLDAGWGLSTQADFAVITNTGDTQSATKVSAVGINASDGISANFIDKTTFAGQIGVKLQKGDMRWGLGYSVNTSSHNTDQMINASWQLSF